MAEAVLRYFGEVAGGDGQISRRTVRRNRVLLGAFNSRHFNRNTGTRSGNPFSRRSPKATKYAASTSQSSRTRLETTIPVASASLHNRDASCTVAPKRSL